MIRARSNSIAVDIWCVAVDHRRWTCSIRRSRDCMRPRRVAVLILVCVSLETPVEAGKATLKNGTILQGELVPLSGLTERQLRSRSGEIETNPYVMVDGTYKKYFVPSRQIADADLGQSLIPFDVFTIKHHK